MIDYATLPGADLVERGLDDLVSGRETAEALLVAVGAPRLRWLGIPVPDVIEVAAPEQALYAWFEARDRRSAHSHYNAAIRRLVSFESALEGELFRRRRRTRDAAGDSAPG